MDGVSEVSPWTPSPALDSPATTLQVDLSIYSTPSLLRACYQLNAWAHFALSRVTATDAVVSVFPKPGAPPLRDLVARLLDELLDQRLRETIARETSTIRELIVAEALAEGNLLEAEEPLAVGEESSSHGLGGT